DSCAKIRLQLGKLGNLNILIKWTNDAFSDYFPEQGATEDKLWKGLMFTAVGLVTLGTMVARS
uniref:Uncharacterized protein n=1 Tax=Magallana gigas TaxID=29159 RepID=A0A8W8I471_MAGGI